jgi:TonB family protein
MSIKLKNVHLVALLILLGLNMGQSVAQKSEDEVCGDPIYVPKELTRRAKIISIMEPTYTEEARAKGVRGTVVLTAVFCRTGKVTNIEVVQKLPYGLTEKAVESTRGIKFQPAEKDGEVVSQRFRRECSFSLY